MLLFDVISPVIICSWFSRQKLYVFVSVFSFDLNVSFNGGLKIFYWNIFGFSLR